MYSEASSDHYCVFGASLDTGNFGVTALGLSVVLGVARRQPSWRPFIFDYQRGFRRRELQLDAERTTEITEVGASSTRRFYRTDTLNFMRMVSGWASSLSPGLRILQSSVAVLDASAGDSFTDMYGKRRFSDVTARKRLALAQQKRLILLPQTYGPFSSTRSENTARRLVCQATAAWARDHSSHQVLKELLGRHHDCQRHREGVDLAFSLPPLEPDRAVADFFEHWRSREAGPHVGINVSGLLYNKQRQASKQYGLTADYRKLIHAFVRRLLVEAEANVLLVPHVISDPEGGAAGGESECDMFACNQVFRELEAVADGRLGVLKGLTGPREAKWAIGQLDWFCGTRMHSTIAALSSCVATAALSYSYKTRGVFATCGIADNVIDPRALDTEQTVEALWTLYLGRNQCQRQLQESVPKVIDRAEQQMDDIVAQMATPHCELRTR